MQLINSVWKLLSTSTIMRCCHIIENHLSHHSNQRYFIFIYILICEHSILHHTLFLFKLLMRKKYIIFIYLAIFIKHFFAAFYFFFFVKNNNESMYLYINIKRENGTIKLILVTPTEDGTEHEWRHSKKRTHIYR